MVTRYFVRWKRYYYSVLNWWILMPMDFGKRFNFCNVIFVCVCVL